MGVRFPHDCFASACRRSYKGMLMFQVRVSMVVGPEIRGVTALDIRRRLRLPDGVNVAPGGTAFVNVSESFARSWPQFAKDECPTLVVPLDMFVPEMVQIGPHGCTRLNDDAITAQHVADWASRIWPRGSR